MFYMFVTMQFDGMQCDVPLPIQSIFNAGAAAAIGHLFYNFHSVNM